MDKKPQPRKRQTGKKYKQKQQLNEQQKRFSAEYLIDLNATQAYIRAGYKARGNAAEVNAARLLRHAQVAKLIQAGMDKRAAKIEVTAERVLQEIAALAFSNMQDFTQIQGDSLRPDMSKVTRDQLAAVQEFTVDLRREKGDGGSVGDEIERFRFKLADKRASLELLGRHLKLFTDKVEVDLTDRAAALIEARRRREAAVR